MHYLKILAAFTLLGTAYYALDKATRPPDRPTHGAGGSEVVEIIAERTGLRLSGVVTTLSADGSTDFRALLDENGRLRPVFGTFAVTCSTASDRTDCIAISDLMISGQEAIDRIAALPEKVEPNDDIDAEIETADIRPAGKIARVSSIGRDHGAEHDMLALHLAKGPPIPTPRPRLAMVDTAKPPTSPTSEKPIPREPTHRIAANLVNARTGPSLEARVITRLDAGLRLIKTGEQDGWGRFVVLDGSEAGREIWASLSIVKAID